MRREFFYDKLRKRHILRASRGERSLQMSYDSEPDEETLDNDFELMANKLKLAEHVR